MEFVKLSHDNAVYESFGASTIGATMSPTTKLGTATSIVPQRARPLATFTQNPVPSSYTSGDDGDNCKKQYIRRYDLKRCCFCQSLKRNFDHQRIVCIYDIAAIP